MKHVKIVLIVLMFAGLMYQQKLLQEVGVQRDNVFGAFAMCVNALNIERSLR